MEAKFTVGEVVYHTGKRCKGTIRQVFESGDDPHETNRVTPHYRYQYYVEHSGHLWSVPEYALFKFTRKPHP